MTGELDADSALVPAAGGWQATVSPRWNVGTNPNGGYLLVIAARAMLATAGRPDPLSVTAHYVSPPEPGPVDVGVDVVRAGRRYATLEARLVQAGTERVRVLGAVGDLAAQSGPTRVSAAPPELPAPDRCVALAEVAQPFTPEVLRRFDVRLPADSPWFAGGGSPVDGSLAISGWIRFADRTEPSVLGLLAYSDAFPPTVLNTGDVGWVPTIELTAHVRSRPGPGWVLASFRTRFLVDGLLEEDGELWSEAGELLALSRQLALVLPRR